MSPAPAPTSNGSAPAPAEPKKTTAVAAAPAATKESDPLDEAMDKYDKVVKRFGDADKAHAFLEAVSKEGPPLAPERKSPSTRSAARAPEMLAGHSHDMTFQCRGNVSLPERPPGYGAACMSEGWEIASIDGADNPSELKPETWKIVVEGNRLLHAYALQPNGLLARARFPAFTLKDPAGLPDFETYDDSSVQIKETNKTIESSMAANGFSSNAIQASASGGFGGVSVAASGAFTNEHQESKSSCDFQDRKEYTACYSFPRVRLYMDQLNMNVSPLCKTALESIVKAADAIAHDTSDPKKLDLIRKALSYRDRFFDRFGHVFLTKLLLGGQITATKSAESLGTVSDTQKRDAMKWSAAVSVESKYVSGSVSGGQEKIDAVNVHNSTLQNAAALAWAARGGNTLLAPNPAEWANSVGGFRTWRPLEQDGLYDVINLISQLSDKEDKEIWAHVPGAFDLLEHYRYAQKVAPSITGPVPWRGRFMLQASDGRMVKWNGVKLELGADNNERDATIFRALNADISVKGRSDPEMIQDGLLSEWPLVLVTAGMADKYAQSESFNGQIPGLWVDDNGDIHREVNFTNHVEVAASPRKICRWSLRRPKDGEADLGTPWRPNPQRIIADGDKVKLYCHSFNCGMYRDVKTPPYFAPAVHWKPGTVELKVLQHTVDDLRNSVTFQWSANNAGIPLFSSNGTMAVLQNDRNALQKRIEQYDQFLELPADNQQLDQLRRLYGAYNFEEARGFFKDSKPRLDYPITGTVNGVDLQNDDQFYQRLYKDAAVKGIWRGRDAWRSSTKFTEQVEFTVKYVRF